MLLLKRKMVSTIILTLVLAGTSTLAFNVQWVRANGTIYITTYGIFPATAPISTVDNITCTLTGDISDSIVVQGDNITLDGKGFTVDGANTSGKHGIDVTDCDNVTVKNLKVTRWDYGIWVDSSSFPSSNNTILNNSVTECNWMAITMKHSTQSTISGNNLTDNNYGIWVQSSFSNTVSCNIITGCAGYALYIDHYAHHNVFTGNVLKENDIVDMYLAPYSDDNTIAENTINNVLYVNSSPNNTFLNNSIGHVTNYGGYANIWDNGYEGNYYSEYVMSYPNASEIDASSIWNTPYVIDANNQDNHPRMFPIVHYVGDVNSDGIVDVLDGIHAASAFGSYPQQANWNMEVDLNYDGLIDIFDFIILSGRFGKTV
jgi:parallel beta-helix repeat protein